MNHKFLPAAFISSALTLIPGVARADWVNLTNSSERQYFIDDSTIERRGDTIFYWQQSIFTVPQRGSMKSQTGYLSVNCQNRIYRTHRVIAYNVARKVIVDGNFTEKQSPPQTIIPGTKGEIIYKAVCYNY